MVSKMFMFVMKRVFFVYCVCLLGVGRWSKMLKILFTYKLNGPVGLPEVGKSTCFCLMFVFSRNLWKMSFGKSLTKIGILCTPPIDFLLGISYFPFWAAGMIFFVFFGGGPFN